MVAVNYLKNTNDMMTVKAGDVIYTAGDAGDVMYGVLEGRVQMVHNDLVLDTAEAGGILGEEVMIGEKQYTATAIAITDVTLSKMDRRQFLWLVHETPTFATQVMHAMSARIQKVAQLLD